MICLLISIIGSAEYVVCYARLESNHHFRVSRVCKKPSKTKIMKKKSMLILAGMLALPMSIHAETAGQPAQAAAPAAEGGALERDIKALQGKWKCVGMEAAGNQGPPEVIAVMKYEFKGMRLIITPAEPGTPDYSFKLNPAAKPIPTFDMISPGEEGETLEGIYALEGNKLRICLGKQKRPTEFVANEETGFGQMLITLERK